MKFLNAVFNKMRTGRTRKPNVRRDKNGKSRGEIETVHPETLAVRKRELQRDGVDAEQALNALAGFTLGRLYLRFQKNPQDLGAINEKQYYAGSAWNQLIHKHASIMGYELKRNVPSPGFVMVSNTDWLYRSTGYEAQTKEEKDRQARIVERISEDFRACYDKLAEESRAHGIRVTEITYGVCIENWPVSWLSEKDHGALRIGLNAIARVLK